MAPKQNRTETKQVAAMPASPSTKNVPDPIAGLLRKRAARNRRSLQGELLPILEESVTGAQSLSPSQLVARVRASGLRPLASPPRSSAQTAMPVSVVDASAMGALLFGEPSAERMAAAMKGH